MDKQVYQSGNLWLTWHKCWKSEVCLCT